MSGPSGGRLPSAGGEYIGPSDATPTTASGITNASGNVSVILNSGAVAGPVTITAAVSVGSASATASSSVISIGGGVPSGRHFDLVTKTFNLPGLVFSNIQTTLSAFIADRFGNYNVLQGTTVSFYAFESGAVNTSSNTLDNTGATSVVFRTQAPPPERVAMTTAEGTAITNLNTRYFTNGTLPAAIAIDGSVNPRNGWVTVFAGVMGEETFNDLNGNGLYDGTEPFTDLGEPFADKNNDGCRNDGASANCNSTAPPDPFEEYIDTNGNGAYNAPNGVWDGPGCTGANCLTNKMIWKDITLAFTGNAAYCAAAATDLTGAASTFTLANGDTRRVFFMVGDRNLNRLVPGTTISIASSGAVALTPPPPSALTIADGVGGPTEISFTISDPDPATTTVNPAPYTLTISVTPTQNVIGCALQVSGTTK
ncbi:MAG TPA: hypothetical protein VK138_10700 [Acidiferrobacterales bacterium]|nr:hypothetical protein [Acidiferrobacterales bacterium]